MLVLHDPVAAFPRSNFAGHLGVQALGRPDRLVNVVAEIVLDRPLGRIKQVSRPSDAGPASAGRSRAHIGRLLDRAETAPPFQQVENEIFGVPASLALGGAGQNTPQLATGVPLADLP